MHNPSWLMAACLLASACGARTGLGLGAGEADAGTTDAGHDGGLPGIPAWSCLGEELIAVELPSLALGGSESWSVAITNPNSVSVEVLLESVDGAGVSHVVGELSIAAGDSAEVPLRRELARRASVSCLGPEDCDAGEVCQCTPVDCSCGSPSTDPEHRAIRVRSSHPVLGVQINPATDGGSGSADTSTLIPLEALRRRYTVIGWPQPSGAWDGARLSATISIVATRRGVVTIDLPASAGSVLVGTRLIDAGDRFEAELGEMETLDMATTEIGGDFTGARIEASVPVAVFSGVEASEVPASEVDGRRICCADHLETQLIPDELLASYYLVPALPNRVEEINRLLADPIEAAADPLYVRVVAITDGVSTTVTGTPFGEVTLAPREHFTFPTEAPVVLVASSDIAVLLAAASQDVPLATSITGGPIGDPSITILPPPSAAVDYIAFTPRSFTFDYSVFVSDTAGDAAIDDSPDLCSRRAGPGITQHTCRLAAPLLDYRPGLGILVADPGVQRDGAHVGRVGGTSALLLTGSDFAASYLHFGCAGR